MNAVMTTHSLVQPLPAVLDAPLAFNLLHRRRNIGEYRPTSFDLSRFNDLLARLGRTQGPVDVDQLATAARQLSAAADGEVDLDDADELLARPTAWLFGNEAHGLDPDLAARADHRVRIPIHGRAESLNLATAAAICLYSSARVQHRPTGPTT